MPKTFKKVSSFIVGEVYTFKERIDYSGYEEFGNDMIIGESFIILRDRNGDKASFVLDRVEYQEHYFKCVYNSNNK